MHLQGHMVTVSLKGYIFFGSALRISSEVQQIAEVNCCSFPCTALLSCSAETQQHPGLIYAQQDAYSLV